MKAVSSIVLVLIMMSLSGIVEAKVSYQFEDSEQLTVFDVSGSVRGYYLNDQRVQWSGMEAVFFSAANNQRIPMGSGCR
ncbi:MAG: hypothetical protein Q8K00_05610 [Syntrophales bacterium]|nr:hypothetical protein [Syntrophales bacterium]